MRIWLAEFIGTFTLVFSGIASIMAQVGQVEVALSFGLSVAVMIAAVGGISGAHFNPAVSVSFYVLGKINFKQLLRYVSAQLFGAVVALTLLSLLDHPKLHQVTYGMTQIKEGMSLGAAFILEAMLTFFLMFVIASLVLSKHPSPGFYIGLTVTLGALIGGQVTGASMNPARSFAPAVFAQVWTHHWLYWLAPIVGAVLAAIMARFIQHHDRSSNQLTS